MKKLIASLLTLLFIGSATSFAASFTIICNVSAAKVFINGKEAGITTPNFSFPNVPPGKYQVRVQKNGYKTYEEIITVGNSPVTITVNLVEIGSDPPVVVVPTPVPTPTPTPAPKNYNVKVTSNVQGADVYVNNSLIGKTPITLGMIEGTYNIVVKASGYNDYSQVLNVNNNTSVNAVLQASVVSYTINNLFNGAQIFINGNRIAVANGNSVTVQIAPGTYTLTIKVAGFLDFTTQITITGNQNLSPTFQPMLATVTLVIPNNMVSRESKENGNSKESRDSKGNRYGDIRFYVDGDDVDIKRSFTVTAGRHSLRLVSGFLSIETSFDFEAGRSYTIEPFAGLNIK